VAHEDLTALLVARRERNRARMRLVAARREHAAVVAGLYEELWQSLAAINLAAHVLGRSDANSSAVATIRTALDEARQELRLLRYKAEQGQADVRRGVPA
jgi:hypothetical protein